LGADRVVPQETCKALDIFRNTKDTAVFTDDVVEGSSGSIADVLVAFNFVKRFAT